MKVYELAKINKDVIARKRITENLQRILEAQQPINLRIIDRQVQMALDDFELDTGAFWRLRTYFAYKHKDDLPREDLYAFNWGITKKSKRR